jgi:hypothetical protein
MHVSTVILREAWPVALSSADGAYSNLAGRLKRGRAVEKHRHQAPKPDSLGPMIGFWNAIIVLTLVLTAGGLVKSWMKHRLELKRLELEQTRQENQRLRSQLELWQRQLAGRVETLETIATGADDELKQKLLALSAPSGAPPHSTDNG